MTAFLPPKQEHQRTEGIDSSNTQERMISSGKLCHSISHLARWHRFLGCCIGAKHLGAHFFLYAV